MIFLVEVNKLIGSNRLGSLHRETALQVYFFVKIDSMLIIAKKQTTITLTILQGLQLVELNFLNEPADAFIFQLLVFYFIHD